MGQISVFDTLVKTLSTQERKDLLQELKHTLSLRDEPLYQKNPASEEFINLEKEYGDLGFLTKIIIFIKSVFTGKDRLILVEQTLLLKLEKQIRNVNPGIMDFTGGKYLKVMYDAVEQLSNASRFFHKPIRSVYSSEKMDFFSFLAGMEIERVHDELLKVTNLFNRSSELRGKNEYEIRNDFEEQFKNILTQVTKEDRERMYGHAKSLDRIRSFVDFPYTSILEKFHTDVPETDPWCSHKDIEKRIIELGDMLAGLNAVPDARLMQALCLFQNREELESEEFDMRMQVKKYIDKAEQSLDIIRDFNRIIPLPDILKYIKNNINYHPSAAGGGEDWFQLFKKFWRGRFEDCVQSFMREQKRKRLIEDALELAGVKQFNYLQYYRQGEWFKGISLPCESSVLFIKTFIETVFLGSMQRALKIVLLNGEFYKDQNRQEFSDSFSFLNNIPGRLEEIDKEFSPQGTAGQAIERLKGDVMVSRLKFRQIEHHVRGAEHQFEELIKGSLRHLKQLISVLKGITHGEVGGKYDTLSNRQYIGGRENKTLLEEIDSAGAVLDKALNLLYDLNDLGRAG